MSKIYDKYVGELEEFSNSLGELDLTNPNNIQSMVSKCYTLYKNGNFLIIESFASIAKILYNASSVKDIIDLALNLYLVGPTKILDLDYEDQKKFLLDKANFLTYYALNIDSSYKDMALKELNYYANMYTDGKHLYSKAMLEKPKDENDTLSQENYKNLLYEYYSYGNELDDDLLELLHIDKNLTTLDIPSLKLKLKEYKNDPDTLKSIYYILLNKGENYAFMLAEIDPIFKAGLDYYIKRRFEFDFDDDFFSLIKDNNDPINNGKPKKKNLCFTLTILFIVIRELYRYFKYGNESLKILPFVIIITLFVLIKIKKSKILNILFSSAILLESIYYIYTIYTYKYIFSTITMSSLFLVLIIIFLVLSTVKAFKNTKAISE